MAKAESTLTVEVIERKVELFNLTLTKEEAATLQVVLARVSGCPEKSERKHTDAIFRALANAGVYWHAVEAADRARGSLTFVTEGEE